jgi:hypothetical protein
MNATPPAPMPSLMRRKTTRSSLPVLWNTELWIDLRTSANGGARLSRENMTLVSRAASKPRCGPRCSAMRSPSIVATPLDSPPAPPRAYSMDA